MNGRWPGIGVSRAAAVLWTPADLGADIDMWLDATDPSTLTVDGSNRISEWRSVTKGGATLMFQGTTNFQPIHDAADKAVVCRTDANVALNSVYDSPPVSCVLAVFRGDKTNKLGVHFMWSFGVYALGEVTGSLMQSYNEYFNPPAETPMIIGHQKLAAGVTREISLNGTVFGGGEWSATAYPAQKRGVCLSNQLTGTSETVNRRFVIGNAPGATAGTMRLHEVVAVPRTLITQEREKMEGWAAHKWSTAGDLPAGHPYKNAPPTK
jgi:hypothetical protein